MIHICNRCTWIKDKYATIGVHERRTLVGLHLIQEGKDKRLCMDCAEEIAEDYSGTFVLDGKKLKLKKGEDNE